MVEVFAGDLVKSGGVEFHIKYIGDGVVQFWCSDTHETQRETWEEFVERCRQRGNFILEPNEGKFDSHHRDYGRERYVEVAE